MVVLCCASWRDHVGGNGAVPHEDRHALTRLTPSIPAEFRNSLGRPGWGGKVHPGRPEQKSLLQITAKCEKLAIIVKQNIAMQPHKPHSHQKDSLSHHHRLKMMGPQQQRFQKGPQTDRNMGSIVFTQHSLWEISTFTHELLFVALPSPMFGSIGPLHQGIGRF